MIDRDRIVGGFDGSIRSMMSPQLQRRIAEEEAREAREARQEEKARAERAEAFQAANVQAAIAQAIESGQEWNPRMLRGQGYGRTRQEAIQYYSELQDMEDRRAEAREAKEFENWKIQRSTSLSGDTSVHTVEAERAEETWRQDQRARVQVQRGRDLRRRRIIDDARKAALNDTTRAICAVERARPGYW
jgi:hypothetical protein